jgi:hypothetical protein
MWGFQTGDGTSAGAILSHLIHSLSPAFDTQRCAVKVPISHQFRFYFRFIYIFIAHQEKERVFAREGNRSRIYFGLAYFVRLFLAQTIQVSMYVHERVDGNLDCKH